MDDKRTAILYHTNKILSKLYGRSVEHSVVNTYAEQLEKSVNHRLTSQANTNEVKRLLSTGNPRGNEFLEMYNALKLQNFRELDPLVLLLGKIKRDPDLFNELNKDQGGDRLGSGSGIKYDTVDQLQKQIQNSNANTLAETSRDVDYSSVTGESGFNPRTLTMADENQSVHLTALPHYQQVPHYYATFATADTSANSVSTIKSKNKTRSRKRQPLRQFPAWMYEVFSLSADFLPRELLTSKEPSVLPLETLPLNAQESLVVQDILDCLDGDDGAYIKSLPIKTPHDVRNFAIDEKMHPSLLDTVNTIAPLFSHYSLVVRFTEEKSCYEYGRVNQALADAMTPFLREYWKLTSHLEEQYRSNQLGISRLLFLLKDTQYLFSQLAQLATKINTGGCTGGATLSVLHEVLNSDASVQRRVHDCMLHLVRCACEPFFDTLRCWIYRGILQPQDEEEFFIVKSKPAPRGTLEGDDNALAWDYINAAASWEQSYTINRTQLPGFLESRVDKILKTGKYLNVVRQCDGSLKLPDFEPIVFSENEKDYLSPIDQAHTFASRTLLDLIIKQRDLKGILKSIKRYFLMDHGDFIVHFMDTAAGELRKPISQIRMPHLNSLLEWALRTSSAYSDPYKDNLRVACTNCDLITQMLTLHVAADGRSIANMIVDMDPSGLEAFSLDYKVDWPVDLVVNRYVIERYQMIFRHLFYCRHVERHLCSSWSLRKAARRVTSTGALNFNKAFMLGQRMLTYIQQLQQYMTIDVIEPNWRNFFKYLDKADNLEEVLDAHTRCLDACMDGCLLTSPDLLAIVGKLNAVCIQFANCLNRIADASLDDTLERVPMSSAASMQCLNAPWRLGKQRGPTAAPSLTSLPALQFPIGRSRRFSVASSSDGGAPSSLFRVGDSASVMGDSSLDVRRKVATSDLSNVGANERFAAAVDDFGLKFNSLMVKLILKTQRPVDQERRKLIGLASSLDFNGYYAQHNVESTPHGLPPSGIGDLRTSMSMSSLSTAESAAASMPRTSLFGTSASLIRPASSKGAVAVDGGLGDTRLPRVQRRSSHHRPPRGRPDNDGN